MLKYITATTHVLTTSKTDEFLMHMTEHFVNINYNHQIDVLWCECLIDNLQCFDFPRVWVRHSNLRDEHSCRPILSDSHFTTVNTVSPRFEWTLRFHPELRQWHESPRIEGIAFESPRFDLITHFWGWPSTSGERGPWWRACHVVCALFSPSEGVTQGVSGVVTWLYACLTDS